MSRPAITPTHDNEIVFSGLFSPALGASASATTELSLPVGLVGAPAVAAHLNREGKNSGLWLAALAFLASRWLGRPDACWLEAAPARTSASGTPLADPTHTDAAPERMICLPIPRLNRVEEWLAQVDAARSTDTPASTGIPLFQWAREIGLPTGRSDNVPAVWIGCDDAPAGQRVTTCSIRASAQLVDHAEAQRLADCVLAVVNQWLADPAMQLANTHTIDAVDRQHQCVDWNPPLAERDPAATVHGAFARQVSTRPEATAVVDGDRQLDYRALDAGANALAHDLLVRGVRPGDRVGLLLDRSAQALIALLGILKAGAAYVPVQPEFPAERIAFMLADAGVQLVLTEAAHRHRVPQGLDAMVLGDVLDAPEQTAGSAPALPVVDTEAIAYVMYTSGSTGQPKGIEIPHRAILRLVVGAQFIDLHPGQAVLHAAPLGFDAATLEIWGPLLNGGTCAVHPETVPTGPGLARSIERHKVHTAWLTAALFNAVVDDDPRQLGGLTQLFTGGEALSVQHVRKALAALPDTQLFNGYGPTECTTFAATLRIPRDLPATTASVPIGRPIDQTVLRVLGPALDLLPSGFVGELCIGGPGLARGYLNQPDLTAERFVADPYGAPGERLYRTGDRARWLDDGTVEFLGRADGQIKIRGHRVETGEIEAALLASPFVRSCAVIARADANGRLRLLAYLIAEKDPIAVDTLRADLARRLPEAMVPTAYVWLDALPVTTNGKLDRRALPDPAQQRPDLAEPFEQARNDTEQAVCAAFAEALAIDRVGRNDNFFDLGGDSLLVVQVVARLQAGRSQRLSTNLVFNHATPRDIAAELDTDRASVTQPEARATTALRASDDEPIALIAMAGRFPGAADVEQFWDNLVAGRDTIRFFDDATLDAGVSAALRADPSYVRARGVIDGIEDFDAAFFGINPREAQLMDPQQRVFLEICWEALERAGYAPDRTSTEVGAVGVYGGMYNASYFQRHVSTRPDLIEAVGEFQVMLGNEKDYITTRVANRLNLTGPAISIHTACSTSLVAIAHAFHALRSGQCDMALAGGASITCPPRSGYLYQEGSMLSPDGHTRSFSSDARGTVFSDGAAVVLLKRLSQAQADGDPIYAVLRGAATNNDGGAKASFTAPSVDGQARVIAAALASAGVDARSISYVETHGTATPMGDPIEVEGLTRAFGKTTSDTGFCAIGSVKSNVGHMVTAAGAGGLIKTALALHTGQLPASLHFEAANPAIDFESTPFFVNAALTSWPRGEAPRRAGVSAFGVGGTNAHVIVEEAPPAIPSDPATGPQLLTLSARSAEALAQARERLADHLESNPDLSLADVAHTLRVGRKAFVHRCAVVATSPADAAAALRDAASQHVAQGSTGAAEAQPVLMFPGQGAQYARMGTGLLEADPVFRAAFDECIAAFDGVLDVDLRERLASTDPAALSPTSVTQPATFALEYALARQMLAVLPAPAALIGHSVGEFVAAVLAGVMRLSDAARLVARRGALMQALPAGAMLSVRLPADKLEARLPAGLSLAADNGPMASVAAGPFDAIEAFRAQLEADDVPARVLQTSHAFHSSMMEPAVEPFAALAADVTLSAPRVPVYSTLTGRLLSDAEATDPRYWARHLREAVRFAPAVATACADMAQPVFIEVGPRTTLTTLVRQQGSAASSVTAVPTLGDAPEAEANAWRLAVGKLWTLGCPVDLAALDTRARKSRLCLPTTPFDRKRFWVDIADAAATSPLGADQPAPAPTATPTTSAAAAQTGAAPTVSTVSEPPMPAASRHPLLVARLRELFEDISGLDMAAADAAAPFIELGLDSLILTQAATQVKKQFKVALTFRQLMSEHRSLDAVARYLDQSLPPEPASIPAPSGAAPATRPAAAIATAAAAAPASAMATMPAPLAMPMGGNGTLVQQVIAQQMQLMQQQLAMLAGTSAAMPSTAPPEPPTLVASTATTPAVAPATGAADAQRSNAPAPDGAGDDPDAVATNKYDVKKAFGAIARIHSQSQEPTDRQKVRLAAFVRRYVERTKKSKAFTAHNRPHMADPRVVNGFRPVVKEITYQIVVERSKGSRLWDVDGNEYVDVLNGFGMNLFGWQPEFVQEAVRRQLDAGYEIGPQHPLAADVTRLICELTGFERSALCNTGSEAVMACVRIARTVTGRSTVVAFSGSYHGTFDEVVVRAGRQGKGIPAAPGIMRGMFGDIRVLEYGTPEALEFIRQNADDLAAVLVEPVQSRRPDFQPREFLHEVRAITKASGTCLIFDEVITGFRSCPGGAQAHFGVRADLASYGKVIGGGFPVGVVAGTRDYMDALDGGAWQYGDDSIPTVGVTYFAGTFVRHPLALAACKASLEHLKAAGPSLQQQLNLHTAAMADELTAFCKEVGAPIEVRYFASLWRVAWLEDHPLQDLLFAMMRSRGVHILDNFPCFMTTAHTREDIATIKSAFKEAVSELQEADFIPKHAQPKGALDAAHPPVPNARLGRDRDGQPAWFVPDPNSQGKFVKINA